jgi:hypothetical protein
MTSRQKRGGAMAPGAPSPRIESIPLALIQDADAQMRVEKIRTETVNDYAEAMLKGDKFPPVIVYHDGADYWLGDGYHRVKAAKKAEFETIDAEVQQGTAKDAILCGAGANATHGLQRTQADKRKAIVRLLTDPEWARWSDRKVAEATKTDHKTVGKIRRELSCGGGEIPTKRELSCVEGEIPGKPELNCGGGEIPAPTRRHAMPHGSLVTDFLSKIPDEALLAECRRRSLLEEAV